MPAPDWSLLLRTPAFEVTALLLGLIVGSFANVCIHRLPLGLSVVRPPSRCPGCGKLIKAYDNLPVLSFFLLRGRCRACGVPISWRYPAVEAANGLLWLALAFWHGPAPRSFVEMGLVSALLVLSLIDLDHQILPDVITLPGIVAGFVCSWFLPPGPLMSLAGIAVGGGILWLIAEIWFRVRKVEAMGFGDVKMLAMVGAFLGVKLVALVFVLSSILGGIVGIVLIASRRADMATKVPFGTMIAVAALVASLYGDAIIAWYAALFAVS